MDLVSVVNVFPSVSSSLIWFYTSHTIFNLIIITSTVKYVDTRIRSFRGTTFLVCGGGFLVSGGECLVSDG